MGSSISSRPSAGAADWDNEGRAFSRLFFESSDQIRMICLKDVRRERTSRVTGTESRWTVALLRTPLSIGNPCARPRDICLLLHVDVVGSRLSDGVGFKRRNNYTKRLFAAVCRRMRLFGKDLIDGSH